MGKRVKESGEGKNSGNSWGDSGEERESVGEKGGEVGVDGLVL